MLDLNFIRENAPRIKEVLKIRSPKLDFDAFLKLDAERRQAVQELDGLRAEKNRANDEISKILKEKGDPKAVIASMKSVSQKIAEFDSKVGEYDQKLRDIVLVIPNIPHESVPFGTDSTANKPVSSWGEPRKFDFKPLEHTELGENLGVFDLARGSKISGSGFSLFGPKGAPLVRGLINFMLDIHTREHGYQEWWPPLLVNRATMTGTGQLPKFEEDLYRLKDDDLFLIPTAEVPVTNILRDEVLKEEEMPVCYTAYTPCFRREAGTYGKDTKGLVRVHQFDKVELVKFTTPESSYAEHEKLLKDAEKILRLLGLPYRVLLLCSGDMGFSAAKCYDIEVWAPGLNRWLEVSSCSNFEDFQARRANIRFKRKGGTKSEFVHTLNGSGLALPRVIIGLLENFQNPDGSVVVPEALRPYLGGVSVLKK